MGNETRHRNYKNSIMLTTVLMFFLCVLIVFRVSASERTNGDVTKKEEKQPVNNPAITIALDPGHGGEENGAYYYGMKEKDVNYQIALQVKEELEKYPNVTVVLTRGEDEQVGLQQRVTRASENKANLFVSLHLNATVAHKATGATVYVTAAEGYRQKMQDLADLLLGEFEQIGLTNNGTISRVTQLGARRGDGTFNDYYGVLRHASNYGIPSLLVEHCFMDHEADLIYLKDKNGLHKLAQADANAIAAYYGLTNENGVKAQEHHAKVYGGTSKGIELNSFDTPKVLGVKLDSYSGTTPGIATFEIDVEDANAVNSLYLVFRNSSGNSFTVSTLFEGELSSGKHLVKAYIPAFLDLGSYELSYVGASNVAGYEVGYNNAGGTMIGFGKCDWQNTFSYNGEAGINVTEADSISTVKNRWLKEEIETGHRQKEYRVPALLYPR